MPTARPDHYATLGLDRNCTAAQIRAAYRLLAREFHPDLNGGTAAAVAQTQALNAAYEILGDPTRRCAYDHELAASEKANHRPSPGHRNLAKDVYLRLEEFLRGTSLEVCVTEPITPAGPEKFDLVVPPDTAPGTRFRIQRREGGLVVVRVKARPDFRFKVRGSDLRCDLKIRASRAQQGGPELVRGATGNLLRVVIPPKVASGEIIRLAGEGLPKPRGGRGDLLVRILYTPEVRIRRAIRH
jgi:DnaJ-class molecular chaperone